MQIHIRVVAPAFSLGVISTRIQQNASKIIRSLGWGLSFGENVYADNDGSVESVRRRVADIHQSLIDSSVTHIMAVIGGWGSDELLSSIDWELWRNNPKPLIGYSDITSLQVAAHTMSGVASIHGPAFSTLGQPGHLEYCIDQLTKCIDSKQYVVEPAGFWIDDEWFLKLDSKREVHEANDIEYLKPGESSGVAIGGNLSTLITLAGTRYFPDLSGKVLFLEDGYSVSTQIFRRMFLQLLRQPGAERIQGFIFGRHQVQSAIDQTMMGQMVDRFVPDNVPVVVNASFGHTYPVGSFPIGRKICIETIANRPRIVVT